MPTMDEIENALGQRRFDDAVVLFIQGRQHVTFVELERLLEPHLSVKGEHALCSSEFPNLVFWVNMSVEYIELMRSLLQAKKIFSHGASLLTYVVDGGIPSLPMAKNVASARRYQTPHWIPICFCTHPLKEKKTRSNSKRRDPKESRP